MIWLWKAIVMFSGILGINQCVPMKVHSFFFFSFELRPFLLKYSLTLLNVYSAFEIMVGNCESACVGELFVISVLYDAIVFKIM